MNLTHPWNPRCPVNAQAWQRDILSGMIGNQINRVAKRREALNTSPNTKWRATWSKKGLWSNHQNSHFTLLLKLCLEWIPENGDAVRLLSRTKNSEGVTRTKAQRRGNAFTAENAKFAEGGRELFTAKDAKEKLNPSLACLASWRDKKFDVLSSKFQNIAHRTGN